MNRLNIIILLLSNSSKPLTGEYISNEIGFSLRTVRTDMKKVVSILNNNGAILKSKRGIGYWLKIVDKTSFNNYTYQLHIRNITNNVSHNNLQYENLEIMKYMISTTDYFKLENIMNAYYISRSNLDVIIKSFKEIIHKFNLELKSKSNFGVILVGSELMKRLAMLYFFDANFHNIEIKNSANLFYSYFEDDTTEIQKVRNILLNNLNKSDFVLEDPCTQILSRYLILQNKRIDNGSIIKFNNHEKEIISEFYKAKAIAIAILKDLNNNNNNNKELHIDEVLALTLLLTLWQDTYLTKNIKEKFYPIYDNISAVIGKYISEIQDFFVPFECEDYNIKDELFTSIFNYIAHLESGYSSLDLKINIGPEIFATPISTILTNYFSELMKKEYDKTISYTTVYGISRKLSLMCSHISNKKTVNILISSAHGGLSCSNIKDRIYDIINNDLIGEVKIVSMYEARYIDVEKYDLYILEDVDEVFYSYDWHLITINSSSFYEDIFEVVEKISMIYKLKNYEMYSDYDFKLMNDFNCKRYIHLDEYNYSLYKDNTLIRFNKQIEYMAIHKTRAYSNVDARINYIIDFNFQIKSIQDFIAFNNEIKKM